MLKIIQVGFGGFGLSWADIVKGLKDLEATAYVDINEKVLNEAANKHKVPDN